ncbi:PspC domain-containing protein [Leucobacter tenebrionis]|uniref:PspC domain-containing protein n=1 Tax=Leucobacter tenebrionis TaxID=2873270 RepID=UPI001CA6DD07|nr:PspC domain-containing protein [Leucobacter tenebrionis]QZY52999.1 PspC domain-containing protein [Leucobacter tenebrionis]
MNESSESERQGGAPAGQGFFAWLRGLGIVRGTDRWFAGVAGGIAAKAGIDPLIVRGIFVVLALLGGPGVILYLVGWLLLPDFTGRIHVEDIFRGRASAGVLTAAIIFASLVIIPALFGFVLTGAPLLGAPGFWGWDLWSSLNVPLWIPRTAAWLFWIAVLVLGFLWLRRVLLQRGREQRAQQHSAADHQGHASAARDAASGAAPPSSSAPGSAAPEPMSPEPPRGAGFAAASDGSGAERLGHPQADPASAPPADTRSFAERADEFARRASDGAAAWGEQAGVKAARWGEEVGRQADEWSARYAEHHDAHRMGPAQAVITLALALLAAGGTALWMMSLGTVPAVSSVAPAPLIAAIVAALAVLALSLIVAGVRGRHTGWVGFLSACGVFALLITVVLPWGIRFQPFGNVQVDGLGSAGSVVVAGNVNLDLRGLDSNPDEQRDIEVWQLAGSTTVQLPEHRPTAVRVRVLAGNIKEQTAGRDGFRVSGPFLSHATGTALSGTRDAFDDDSVAHVTVYLLAGNVRIEGDGSNPSAAERLRLEEQRRADEQTERQTEAERERLSEAQEELDRVEWQLEEPGLSSSDRQELERRRDDLRETVDDLEQEMAR